MLVHITEMLAFPGSTVHSFVFVHLLYFSSIFPTYFLLELALVIP